MKKHPFYTELNINDLKERYSRYIDSKYISTLNETIYQDRELKQWDIDFLIKTPILCKQDKVFLDEDLINILNPTLLSIDEMNKIRDRQPEIKILSLVKPFKEQENNTLFDVSSELDNYNDYPERYITTDLRKDYKELIGENNSFRYLINYYFIDPFETPEQKLRYLATTSISEASNIKKMILDLYTNTISDNLSLTYMDRALLDLGENEKEYFQYKLKPILELYYNSEGINKIKEMYNNLTKIDSNLARTRSDLDLLTPKDTPKDLAFFLDFLLNEPLQVYIKRRNIKSLEDFDKEQLQLFKAKKIEKEAELKTLDERINKLLKDKNLTDDDIYSFIKENNDKDLELKNIIERDTKIIKHYKEERARADKYLELQKERLEKAKDTLLNNAPESINSELGNSLDQYKSKWFYDVEKITKYKEAKETSKEHIYFLMLSKKILDEVLATTIFAIKQYNKRLKSYSDKNSLNYYFNDTFISLYPYHLVDYEIIEAETEIKKGREQEYSNPVLSSLKTGITIKELTNRDKDTYNKIISKTNIKEDINKDITYLRDESLKLSSTYEEKEIIKEQLKELEATNKELNKKGFIHIDNKPYKLTIATTTDRVASIQSESDTHFSISNIKANTTIIIPKKISIATENKIENTTLDRVLSGDRSERFILLIDTLITYFSNNFNQDEISIPTDELLNKLKYDLDRGNKEANKKAKQRARKELLYLLKLISDYEVLEAYLEQDKKNKWGARNIYTFRLRNYDISKDVKLKIDKDFFKIFNNSRIWKNKESSLGLIESIYHSNLLEVLNNDNKAYKQDTLSTKRYIKASYFVNTIANMKANREDEKNFTRDISKPIKTALNNLNKNDDSSLMFSNYDNIDKINNYEAMNNIIIEVDYKTDDDIPQKTKNKYEYGKKKRESTNKK